MPPPTLNSEEPVIAISTRYHSDTTRTACLRPAYSQPAARARDAASARVRAFIFSIDEDT